MVEAALEAGDVTHDFQAGEQVGGHAFVVAELEADAGCERLAFLGIAAAMIISFTVLPAMLEIGGGKFEPVVEDDEPGDGAEV